MNRPGLEYFPVSTGTYITGNQLLRANQEAIRLGFSRTLKLPEFDKSLRFPIRFAGNHTSCDGLQNIRVMLTFALNTKGDGMTQVFLDMSPDTFANLKVANV